MKFEDPTVSVTQTDERNWKLDRELVYTDRYGCVNIIQVGYTTDFASVPRIIWWLVPTSGNYTAATILHDFLITDMLPDRQVTPREIDTIFRDAMRELGVSAPRRWLMWAGVRWGALFNRKRRAGSLATLAGVLALSLLALPFLLPAVVLLPSLLVFSLLERLFD